MTNGLAILGGYAILLVLFIVLLGFFLRRDPGDKSNTS